MPSGNRGAFRAVARIGLIVLAFACAVGVYFWLRPEQSRFANFEQFASSEQGHQTEPHDCEREARSRALTPRADQIKAKACARERENDRHEQETRWETIRTAQATEQAAVQTYRQAVAAAASVAILALALGASVWAAFEASHAARSADETLEHARESSEKELRAYVHISAPQASHSTHPSDLGTIYIQYAWKNVGKTPASRVFLDSNATTWMPDLPDNYVFPNRTSRIDDPIVLGPDQVVWTDHMAISRQVFEALKQRVTRVFFWSWVEYDDVFDGTPRRRTEVCTELMYGLEANTQKETILFRNYRRHNGADDHCEKKPTAFVMPPPKSPEPPTPQIVGFTPATPGFEG